MYVDNPFQSPAIISFCPGILGLERGLARAGVHCRVVAYVEIEAFIIANLVTGMEAGVLGPSPIWTDAKTFDARPFRGKIHGIIGGYPCTPFSLAGTRSGENHPGHIYPAISRAFEAAKPLWGFFENVDDHLSLGFDNVYQDLHRMGYAVEAAIFSSEEAGSTCERQRLFILAIAPGTRIGRLPKCEQRQEWTEQRDSINGCGETMAISKFTGLERRFSKNDKEGEFGGGRMQAPRTSYPMGQGYEQYEWEPPRIESSMVYNIARYNFREDLVRAVGNSVDEIVAEIAFIDLMNKHFKNS
jgi:site-specific DNA-cytosine methylase